MRSLKTISSILVLLHFAVLTEVASAQNSGNAEDSAFRPTWRLLSVEGKKQFIAGYLYALEGAEDVTQIVLEYVEKHPEEARSGLEKIKSIYHAKGLSPDRVVHELNVFFDESAGKNATLNQAFAVVRSRLGR